MAPAPPSTSSPATTSRESGDEPVLGSAVRDSTLTNEVDGIAVVSGTVVGATTVVDATVGGATVSGIEVVGATVVGATVVAGATVVDAIVVDGTVVVGGGHAGMFTEPGQKGPAALIWADPTMMAAARPIPATAARPNDRRCRCHVSVPFMPSG
jgi:hypothetical protein